jgi:hypothetical protein
MDEKWNVMDEYHPWMIMLTRMMLVMMLTMILTHYHMNYPNWIILNVLPNEIVWNIIHNTFHMKFK